MHEDHTNLSVFEQPPPRDQASNWMHDRAAVTSTAQTAGDVAVAFLDLIPGVHLLVAIDPFADPKRPKSGDIEGLTCNPALDAEKIRDWVNARNGHKNLHWTVNEVRPDFHGNKATKKDIVRPRFAHLDVDVDGANTDEALRALFDRIARQLPPGLEPFLVVASGGGFQILFALSEAITRDANDQEVRLTIEAQNRGLINLFDGDASTWNLDRLLRLAGTENVPNAKKRAMGRVQSKAVLLSKSSASYTRAELAAKVPPISVEQRASTEPEIAEAWAELDGGFYEQCCSEEDLPSDLKDKLEQALNQGNDKLRDFWEKGTDKNEGRKAALAGFLAWRRIDFTVDEYAQLMHCWGFTHLGPDYCDAHLSARSLARAYVNIYQKNVKLRVDRDEQPDWPAVNVEQFFDRDAARSPALQDLMKGIHSVSGKIDPKTIPQREWLVAPRLPIGDVAQLAGEPGVSKSTFTLQDALAVSTGKESILRGEMGAAPDRLYRTGPVILYNAEDRLDEMNRRLTAMQDFFGITEAPHPVHLWSGVDNVELKLMERKSAKEPLVRAAGADLLEEMIVHTGAVLVVLDPQVSLARGAIENSTEDGNDLFQMLARMATKLKISILVVHHTAKHTRHDHGDMGAGRGAFSVMGKVRSAFTLVNVTVTEAKEWGYPPGDDLIRLDYAKVSHGRKPKTATVYRRRSMLVGNGNGSPIGAASAFEASAIEHFKATGDDAPVFEVVGLGMKPGNVPEPVNQGQARRIAVAEAVAKVLGDRTEASLPTIYHQIGGALNEAGVSKSTSRPAITDLVKTSLAGRGVQINIDGQSVWVNAEQRGIGPTAPWFLAIQREELEALKPLEAEGVFL